MDGSLGWLNIIKCWGVVFSKWEKTRIMERTYKKFLHLLLCKININKKNEFYEIGEY